MAKLDEYRKKRDPARTNEPFGPEPDEALGPTSVGAFVVHLHDATRRHFDLRVEVGGVLASFALPKGPTFDPEAKHLAVLTEDHPLEYVDFEAVIPEGQYGAGPMILWDRGAVRYVEAPAEEGMKSGKLDMLFAGTKLNGRFALVRLKGSTNEWLLLKKKDAWATRDPVASVVEPRSVLSGLAVEELARAKEIGAELEARAAALGAKKAGARAAKLVAIAEGAAPADEDAWTWEVKLDGARVLAERSGDDVRVVHAGSDVTHYYPEVARALRALPVARVALEGDAVAFEDGQPSRAKLLARIELFRRGRAREAQLAAPVTLVVSDVLALGARDTSALPIAARKELARALVRAPGVLRAGESVRGRRADVLAFAEAHGLEGVVGRSEDGKRAVLVRAKGAAARPVAIDHDAEGAAPLSERAARPPARFPVTNRAKVFWPEDGLTKGDLCDYYEAIAPTLLPYLRDRPVALVRYPDGIHGKSFFQWNVPLAMPKWVRTLALRPDEDEQGARTIERRGFLVNDLASLVYIANLGCIPIHVLGWRTGSMDTCDFLTVDFDPPKDALDARERVRRAVTLACTLKDVLAAIGLEGYAKTSGQAGLHVLAPLGAPFEAAKMLCELLGRLVVQRHPDLATMERVVARRGDKVYVDTGQTGQGRTIVAPYSVRAQLGATVSVPLTWDEVEPSLDPRAFTMKHVPDRVARRGDPMKPLLEARADVVAAATKLRALFAHARE